MSTEPAPDRSVAHEAGKPEEAGVPGRDDASTLRVGEHAAELADDLWKCGEKALEIP